MDRQSLTHTPETPAEGTIGIKETCLLPNAAQPAAHLSSDADNGTNKTSHKNSATGETHFTVHPVEPEREAQFADDADAFFRAAFGLSPLSASASEGSQAANSADSSGEQSTSARRAEQTKIPSTGVEFDAALLVAVEADVSDALAKIDWTDSTLRTAASEDAEATWFCQDLEYAEEFDAHFQELYPEVHPIAGNGPPRAADDNPIVVTSGTTEASEKKSKAGSTLRKRGKSVQNRASAAVLRWVERDPAYRTAKKIREKQRLRYVAAVKAAKPDGREIAAALNDLQSSVEAVEDYFLATLQVLAHAMLRCGQYGAFPCGSYWCPHCSKRFKARLLEDTQAQLKQRYGDDLEAARAQLLYVTILSDIVIPDPDLDREYGADFAASKINRDHISLINRLRRLQDDRRSAMSDLLAKRKLSLPLARDWLDIADRDRTYYSPDNAIAELCRILGDGGGQAAR